MYNQTLVFPPQKINMIIGVQDWRCHLCYLGPYWCTSLLESIQLNIIEEGVCRNWWLLKLDHREKFILIFILFYFPKVCTIPMTNVWHFFGEYLFILSIYKTRLGNLKLNFWEFQHLKNKYEKVHLLLFICINNPMFGTFFFHKLGILISKIWTNINKNFPFFGQIFCVEHES